VRRRAVHPGCCTLFGRTGSVDPIVVGHGAFVEPRDRVDGTLDTASRRRPKSVAVTASDCRGALRSFPQSAPTPSELTQDRSRFSVSSCGH